MKCPFFNLQNVLRKSGNAESRVWSETVMERWRSADSNSLRWLLQTAKRIIRKKTTIKVSGIYLRLYILVIVRICWIDSIGILVGSWKCASSLLMLPSNTSSTCTSCSLCVGGVLVGRLGGLPIISILVDASISCFLKPKSRRKLPFKGTDPTIWIISFCPSVSITSHFAPSSSKHCIGNDPWACTEADTPSRPLRTYWLKLTDDTHWDASSHLNSSVAWQENTKTTATTGLMNSLAYFPPPWIW